ncbi:MAG: potassium channel family protein [Bariatricus sp.]
MERKNEYTVIAGCGRLGARIAGKLSEQKQDVMVLDCDKTAFRKLPYSYGGLTMVANATDIEKLNLANLKEASAFIAVTDYDCVNICAAQIAKKVFQIPKVVARIYDQEKMELVRDMGVNVICPAELSEKEIANYIAIGGVRHVG